MWIYAFKRWVSTETVASSAAPTNLTVASSFRVPIQLDSTGQTATSPKFVSCPLQQLSRDASVFSLTWWDALKPATRFVAQLSNETVMCWTRCYSTRYLEISSYNFEVEGTLEIISDQAPHHLQRKWKDDTLWLAPGHTVEMGQKSSVWLNCCKLLFSFESHVELVQKQERTF